MRFSGPARLSQRLRHLLKLAGVHLNHARGRHQCAEVKRSARRRWLRLLGTRHDVQIWGPDDRPPPTPSTAMVSGLLASWLDETLTPIKQSVPLLADPEAKLNLVEAREEHALFTIVVEVRDARRAWGGKGQGGEGRMCIGCRCCCVHCVSPPDRPRA